MPPKGAKILCDQGVPFELMDLLRTTTPFIYSYAHHEGWSEIPDNELLQVAAKSGFAILIATDQNMAYQQNKSKLAVGLVVLGTTNRKTLVSNISQIIPAIKSITRPKIVLVPLVTPKATKSKRRRSPPRG